MRFKINIINNNYEEIMLSIEEGENLKKLLINTGIVDFPCGGKGTCGKCKVKIKENIEYGKQELQLLSDFEIENNIHLACKVVVDRDLTILTNEATSFTILDKTNINNVELNTGIEFIDISSLKEIKGNSITSNVDIVGEYLLSVKKENTKLPLNIIKKINCINSETSNELSLVTINNEVLNLLSGEQKSYGVAVDIGTTTLVMYLFDLINGKKIDSISNINPQRRFGYDVISRINYSDSEDRLEELRVVIIDEIGKMLNNLFKNHNLKKAWLNHVVFAGNTTMSHLLVGADVKNFGRVPFTPQFLDMLSLSSKDLGLESNYNAKVTILNNISSFVGGDLVAGIIDTDLDILSSYNLLIDIGTNGEMILGSKDKIFCCATAAGPAFEAANISCGVGSIDGAICKVYKENGEVKIDTIGNKAPVGICGTGLIDLVAYMLDEEIIDEVGYLEEDFVICKDANGKEITITPKDIREVQLAKAAIRAGIECLMEEVNIKIDNINSIFVAGGFGNYLNMDSAIKIGLIPSCKEKLISMGNSAGSGACKILLNNKLLERAKKIKRISTYIELSSNKNFMDMYIENMYFEEK